MVLAVNIVFLEGSTYFQIVVQLISSLVFFSYLVAFRPFDEKLVNFVEILNEGTILICSYLIFAFTDFV